jgi:hypothetical protein
MFMPFPFPCEGRSDEVPRYMVAEMAAKTATQLVSARDSKATMAKKAHKAIEFADVFKVEWDKRVAVYKAEDKVEQAESRIKEYTEAVAHTKKGIAKSKKEIRAAGGIKKCEASKEDHFRYVVSELRREQERLASRERDLNHWKSERRKRKLALTKARKVYQG